MYKKTFVRKERVFRDQITANGSSGFKAEAGRYHLYVCLACPWAHQTLLFRALKGLDDVISATVVDWSMGSDGWNFTDKKPKCSLDPINGCQLMRDVYKICDPLYDGKITIPALFDKKNNVIVNNESSEIIRMLNSEFQEFCASPSHKDVDLYPKALREKIDELNAWIYPTINNGVYSCGFAESQEAYDEAIENLFNSLDKVDGILSKQRYLTGSQITEADIRLFSTLIRFDAVYHTLFMTNKKLMTDYLNIPGYIRDIAQMPAVTPTIDYQHIKGHYYGSLPSINPKGIVPIGPTIDLLSPHGRENMSE